MSGAGWPGKASVSQQRKKIDRTPAPVRRRNPRNAVDDIARQGQIVPFRLRRTTNVPPNVPDLSEKFLDAAACQYGHDDDVTRRTDEIFARYGYKVVPAAEAQPAVTAAPQNPGLDAVDAPPQPPTGPPVAGPVLGTEAVPAVAPQKWADRPQKHGTSPADFINEHYSFCMANLGQHHLRKLDYRLYCYYNEWKKEPGRKDSELVPFGCSFILDVAVRGERVREGNRRSKAKTRAITRDKRDNMPHLDP